MTPITTLPPTQPTRKQEVLPSNHRSSRRFLKLFGLIVLCVVTSVFVTWLLLSWGILKPDVTKTITENREKIVLQEGEIITDVFKKVSPSAVSITIQATGGRVNPFSGQTRVQEGAGSGFIISSNGYILTNKHVVPEGTTKVTVVLADGREFSNVNVVGRDPSNDIAFLKIEGANDLPAAVIGDSDTVEPGQRVVAIGNALGEFRNSVTTGIISGIGRPIIAGDDEGSSEKLENLFQTDAAINPGNSGGPLVNLKGEVIGVNTAVAQEAQGIGFAIPINDAKGMIESIKKQGKIVKPYLGVRYILLDPDTAQDLQVSVTRGAYIRANQDGTAVIANGPAAKAGLKDGDIIVKVNNIQITESKSLSSALAIFVPGDKVNLTIIRDGKEQATQVTLEAYPNL